MIIKRDEVGIYKDVTIRTPQGSWQWQYRGVRKRYRPRTLKSGRIVWALNEVLRSKVACGHIRDGCTADPSPHMASLSILELAAHCRGAWGELSRSR